MLLYLLLVLTQKSIAFLVHDLDDDGRASQFSSFLHRYSLMNLRT